uniref:Dimethylargininase n=1 Tax=Trichuris muris TaxID=70415 RepID=A0A5S6R2T4_TRIMR
MSRFTHAIVTRAPGRLLSGGKPLNVDLPLFTKQQEELCEKLREAGVDVIELAPEDSEELRSLFVDDLAVVCNGSALISLDQPGQRANEVMALLLELGFRVKTLPANDNATFCGSDVLFTGKEFFVGISERTNTAGAKQIARSFPEYPVTAIKLNASKPLKYYVAVAAPEFIVCGASSEAENIVKKIKTEATFHYRMICFNKDASVSCMNVNGVTFTGCAASDVENLNAVPDCTLQTVEVGEMTKNGALLTQYCLLLKKIKHMKNF